eukprot:CAMPEP_0119005972 /NCGR_PEP_ID=MMETSP1176-20130426/2036_1 /TAXON_ID=265551 /ORGANISM="Synedropsis recta cf, Strain CCMP1620" /LENGTH=269 /DNA_ID=CAMNT_0006957839 /DNA_START=159 /DNA_END=968 /DNA_ORIENTATION=-
MSNKVRAPAIWNEAMDTLMLDIRFDVTPLYNTYLTENKKTHLDGKEGNKQFMVTMKGKKFLKVAKKGHMDQNVLFLRDGYKLRKLKGDLVAYEKLWDHICNTYINVGVEKAINLGATRQRKPFLDKYHLGCFMVKIKSGVVAKLMKMLVKPANDKDAKESFKKFKKTDDCILLGQEIHFYHDEYPKEFFKEFETRWENGKALYNKLLAMEKLDSDVTKFMNKYASIMRWIKIKNLAFNGGINGRRFWANYLKSKAELVTVIKDNNIALP